MTNEKRSRRPRLLWAYGVVCLLCSVALPACPVQTTSGPASVVQRGGSSGADNQSQEARSLPPPEFTSGPVTVAPRDSGAGGISGPMPYPTPHMTSGPRSAQAAPPTDAGAASLGFDAPVTMTSGPMDTAADASAPTDGLARTR